MKNCRLFATLPSILAFCLFAGMVSGVLPRSAAAEFTANYDESKIPAFKLPDPLRFTDGTSVETPEQWSARRDELLKSFEKYVYGRMPLGVNELQRTIRVSELSPDKETKARRYVLTLQLGPLAGAEKAKPNDRAAEEGSAGAKAIQIEAYVSVPANASIGDPVPGFLTLNFQGNHTVTDFTDVPVTQSWVRDRRNSSTDGNKALPDGRGVAKGRWPIEMINRRGYAFMTVYYGDIDPDIDDNFANGIHSLLSDEMAAMDESERPGSIAGWAYGLSQMLSAIEESEDLGVDAKRVAVLGHSRLGKTALWAGATDSRFAMVISNDSGCGGAALSRRAIGETIGRINSSFPHWFCDGFNRFNENEQACPVDQHQLLALIAPRPLAVASATKDKWADPVGEFLSAKHASVVYELLGTPGLAGEQPNAEEPNAKIRESSPDGDHSSGELVFPAPDQAYQAGLISYHLRDGKHDLASQDWLRYLDFADAHLR